jgi:hypothetical protein
MTQSSSHDGAGVIMPAKTRPAEASGAEADARRRVAVCAQMVTRRRAGDRNNCIAPNQAARI